MAVKVVCLDVYTSSASTTHHASESLLSSPAPDQSHRFFAIITGSSDGLIEVLGFDMQTKRYTLLHQNNHHKCAVLSIDCVQPRDGASCKVGDGARVLCATASTSGRVVLWDLTSVCGAYVRNQLGWTDNSDGSGSGGDDVGGIGALSPLVEYRAQQSGVNCMCMWCEHDGYDDGGGVNIVGDTIGRREDSVVVYIASGGDDGVITVAKVALSRECACDGVEVAQQFHAHIGTAVTGLVRLPGNILASIGTDQRLQLWQYNNHLPGRYQADLLDDHQEKDQKEILLLLEQQYQQQHEQSSTSAASVAAAVTVAGMEWPIIAGTVTKSPLRLLAACLIDIGDPASLDAVLRSGSDGERVATVTVVGYGMQIMRLRV